MVFLLMSVVYPHLGNFRYHMDLLSITEYLLLNEYH